jgi:hypothetical protein
MNANHFSDRNETSDDSQVLKPCAEFQLRASFFAGADCAMDRSFRRAADHNVASQITAKLKDRGHRVSKVGLGSGGGAGFSCRPNLRCEITIFLGIERSENNILYFYLLTWQTPTILDWGFQGKPKSTSDCNRYWAMLCQEIDDILLESFKDISIVWVKEAYGDADHSKP